MATWRRMSRSRWPRRSAKRHAPSQRRSSRTSSCRRRERGLCRWSGVHKLQDGARVLASRDAPCGARAAVGISKPRAWQIRPGAGKKVQVEFLSANPTGPLTVGHGRNAVLGDTIARLYEAAGFEVTREYYFNDGGRQMKLLGESVRARYLQAHGIDAPMPEDGYQGEYIREIALALKEEHGDKLAEVTDLEIFRTAAVKAIFADINQTCTRLGDPFRRIHQRTRPDRTQAWWRRCSTRSRNAD